MIVSKIWFLCLYGSHKDNSDRDYIFLLEFLLSIRPSTFTDIDHLSFHLFVVLVSFSWQKFPWLEEKNIFLFAMCLVDDKGIVEKRKIHRSSTEVGNTFSKNTRKLHFKSHKILNDILLRFTYFFLSFFL